MFMQDTQEEKITRPIEPELPLTPAKAGLIVFLSIFAFVLVGVLARGFAELFWESVEWYSPFMIVELFIIVPAVYVVKRYGYPLKAAFRLNPVSFDVLLWSLLAGLSLAILGDQLDRIIQSWFPMPAEIIEQLEATFKTPHLGDFILLFLIATIGAGVCEEMLFRGFFQQILEKRTYWFAAILLPAMLFGLIHVLPWLIFQITVLGLILGLIAWRTNSIYPTILIHATNNLVAILFVRFVTPEIESAYLSEGLVDPKIVLVAIAVFIFSMMRIWRVGNPQT